MSEDEVQRPSYKRYYLPFVDIKNYSIMVNGQNCFDQSVRNKLRTYDSFQKIATGQGVYYTTGCLLDCNYFKDYYKRIAIDLRKYDKFDADPKAIQQRSQTICFRFFTKNCKSILILLFALM